MAETHDRLPFPDYDHVPLGHLPSRISALDADGVQRLIDYEREHGDRLPVMQVLQHRLDALQGGAEPSGTVPTELPEVGGPVPPASPGHDTVTPVTGGANVNPPRHGQPVTPGQPRTKPTA
ncbi:MAG TPA: hypothetical protein VN200_10945 [Rhodoglobus sp.]|nr:hypothetical protein [Rhodoglobus sp.]